MSKIDRIDREIEKTRGKITEYQNRLKELEAQRTEQENFEIVNLVRSMCMSRDELMNFLRGVVELTVALHKVFDTPLDRLVWDVGHQSYAHKILTGRKDSFKTKRLYKGISGFPRMTESPYDSFGTGHSSTSISAALGMAIAAKLQGETDRLSVAVIGDGSMTGGLAFEALNNAGVYDSNLLIILNDNNMAMKKLISECAPIIGQTGKKVNFKTVKSPSIFSAIFYKKFHTK